MPKLHTALCHLLHIELPIIQAPISGAATPALVAAVSNAGGLGMFAMANRDPEGIRRVIDEARHLTDRPFGANFLLRPQEETEQFMAAFRRGDAASIAAGYTENGQLLPPNSDVVSGKQAIQTFWQGACSRRPTASAMLRLAGAAEAAGGDRSSVDREARVRMTSRGQRRQVRR